MKYAQIGRKIKQQREAQNLTQQMLADKIGVSWEMISRYERGSSSPFTKIIDISDVLGVPISNLIDDRTDIINPRVPYFSSVPSEFVFRRSDTHTFYNCPEWVFQRDKDVFAISSNIVIISLNAQFVNNNKYINNEIVFFVSPHSKTKAGIVLAREIDKLVVITKEEISHKHIVIGGILSIELESL